MKPEQEVLREYFLNREPKRKFCLRKSFTKQQLGRRRGDKVRPSQN
ncbi:MAG: hypothetical protein ACLUKN_04720 [Bacilli bacterium]